MHGLAFSFQQLLFALPKPICPQSFVSLLRKQHWWDIIISQFFPSVHIVMSNLIFFIQEKDVKLTTSHQCCFLSKETKAWGQTGFGKANESCQKEKARPHNHRYLIEWQMKHIEAQSVLQKHALHCFSIKYQWLCGLAFFYNICLIWQSLSSSILCFFT